MTRIPWYISLTYNSDTGAQIYKTISKFLNCIPRITLSNFAHQRQKIKSKQPLFLTLCHLYFCQLENLFFLLFFVSYNEEKTTTTY